MLTDLQCRKAKAAEKDYKLSDAHGLYLFVTKTGFRSWRWKYRFAGKEKRLVLGRYPDMNLSAAREARQNAARLLKSGIDPALQAKQLAAIRLEEAETRSEEHTSELQSLMRNSYAVFCLKKKKKTTLNATPTTVLQPAKQLIHT